MGEEDPDKLGQKQPEILVYRVHEKVDDDGKLTDKATRKYLGKYLEALYEWVNKFF